MPNDNLITVKITKRTWYALKRVMVYAPDEYWEVTKCFWTLIEAIGDGDDALLDLWREKMAED